MFFTSTILHSQNQNIDPPKWAINLAYDQNLQLVDRNVYPYENSLGSYGSPFIKGIIHTNQKIINNQENWYFKSIEYVLFLCKEKNNEKYFLLFATRDLNSKNPFLFKKLFEVFGPIGMHFLQGDLELKLSDFKKFDDLSTRLNVDLNIEASWTIPVVIPFRRYRQILIFYENDWYVNDLKEW